MFKKGDIVRVIGDSYGPGHTYEIGDICKVLYKVKERILHYDNLYCVQKIEADSELPTQFISGEELELYDIYETKRKWRIANIYNMIDLALIIKDKDMFLEYTKELKKLNEDYQPLDIC